jgi:glycine/sarcosine N-methyltransferase
MVPMTEQTSKQEVASFYDRLAPDYDLMTGFEKRFVHEKPFFRILLEKHRIATALDAGCGTGFHSLLLAQLGVSVTAVDVSAAMVQRLERHAVEKDLRVRTAVSDFQSVPDILREPVDAVFCMGNTLAHLLSASELNNALAAFARVVRPGGILFAQTLNYELILSRRDRIQSVKEAGGVTFVRSYEYGGEFLVFNILRLERGAGGVTHATESVRLRPVLAEELLPLLRGAGFDSIRTFGGISMEEFDPGASKDLVILATQKNP